jgi:hypothetical protein
VLLEREDDTVYMQTHIISKVKTRGVTSRCV